MINSEAQGFCFLVLRSFVHSVVDGFVADIENEHRRLLLVEKMGAEQKNVAGM